MGSTQNAIGATFFGPTLLPSLTPASYSGGGFCFSQSARASKAGLIETYLFWAFSYCTLLNAMLSLTNSISFSTALVCFSSRNRL